MSRMPKFRRHREGFSILGSTREADKVFKGSKESNDKQSVRSKPLEEVRKDAIEVVKMGKGDVNNDLDVQGEYLLQFGRYRGQSFRWMLKNVLGYAGWFVDNIRNEKVTQSAVSQNKAAFKGYVESFEEGREVVAMKTKQREDKEAKIKEASLNSRPRKAASPLATAVLSGHLSTEKYVSCVISSGSAEKFKPTIPTRKKVRKSASSVTELPVASTSTEDNTVTADDEELLAITVEFEKSLESSAHVHQPTAIQQSATTEHVENGLQQGTTTSLALSFNDIDPETPPLPEGWKKTLPKSDLLWIFPSLFTTGTNGKARLDWHRESIHSSVITVEDNPSDGCVKMLLDVWDG